MDLTAFRASLAVAAPPEGLSAALQALWWEAKGDWDKRTRSPKSTRAVPATGSTPISTARRATPPTPAIGIAAALLVEPV